MSPEEWVALATVFIVGAMSPGPSLAVILSNTISGGRSQGIATGIGHGIGFGVYAFLAALGLATALSVHDGVQLILNGGGFVILVWLGFRFIRSSMNESKFKHGKHQENTSQRTGFFQGFMIALFNPKILAWMIALYANFIEPDMGLEILLGDHEALRLGASRGRLFRDWLLVAHPLGHLTLSRGSPRTPVQ